MYIDTHAHIYMDAFEGEHNDIVARALGANVSKIVMPNVDLPSINEVFKLHASHPNACHPMVGLHPCSVKADYKTVLSELYPLLDKQGVVGVGEIGVDLYWDKTFQAEQEESFRMQIAWALEKDYPIAIHSRSSIDVTIRIVSEMQNGNLRGIFHCFSEGPEEAKKIQGLGFLMGIGGVVTFKKNQALRDTIKDVPLSSLVLETDAPYLTPMPYRGKRNESSYIPFIAEAVAGAKEMSVREVAETTTQNALTLFGLE